MWLKQRLRDGRGEDSERGREQPCQGALTQKRTLRGSGALELADLGLLEDGGELGDALDSDVVVVETVQEKKEWGR